MDKGWVDRHMRKAKRKVPKQRGPKKVLEQKLPLTKNKPTNPFPGESWHGWPPQVWDGKKWVYLDGKPKPSRQASRRPRQPHR
jgi:hypothetical protein